MKPTITSEMKKALFDLIETAVMVKMFLPSRRDRYVDVPCLTDQVRNLRAGVKDIEDLLELEFPREPGEDILWRLFAHEVPPDPRPVLVSARLCPTAIVARWIDARWYYPDGTPFCFEVYAWCPLPASCLEQRERLLLTERRAS